MSSGFKWVETRRLDQVGDVREVAPGDADALESLLAELDQSRGAGMVEVASLGARVTHAKVFGDVGLDALRGFGALVHLMIRESPAASVPDWVWGDLALETLDAAGCPNISSLGRPGQSLRTLRVQECPSLARLPDMVRLPNIEEVEVVACGLEATPYVACLPRLKSLTVKRCHPVKQVPPMVGSTLERLERIDLSGNGLAATPPALLGAPNARLIDLSGNRLTKFPYSLCGGPAFDLDLSGNNIADICQVLDLGFEGLPRLSRVDLSDNPIANLRDPRLIACAKEINLPDVDDFAVEVLGFLASTLRVGGERRDGRTPPFHRAHYEWLLGALVTQANRWGDGYFVSPLFDALVPSAEICSVWGLWEAISFLPPCARRLSAIDRVWRAALGRAREWSRYVRFADSDRCGLGDVERLVVPEARRVPAEDTRRFLAPLAVALASEFGDRGWLVDELRGVPGSGPLAREICGL